MADYLPLYKDAALLTLGIGWAGIAGAIVIGLAVALVIHFRVPVARQLCRAYVELFRNTPLLIQLFFFYFGLPRFGLSITPEFCGAFGLALHGGAYMAESFRSGFESVDAIQRELAGARPHPHAGRPLRHPPPGGDARLPSFVANVIFLLKETSVFSAISLMDLMFVTKDLMGLYYRTTECLVMLVLFYLAILLPVSIAGSVIERRLRRGSFGD